MALETVVYPQDPFSYMNSKDIYSFLEGGIWPSFNEDNDFLENQTENSPYGHDSWNSSSGVPFLMVPAERFNNIPSSEGFDCLDGLILDHEKTDQLELTSSSTADQNRRRRRRTKAQKNKDEIENQRMTHIAVERNRRKLMNQYLSVLRSLMPDSYVQRGDQASIIGGAINFVKELEQKVQFLGAQTTDHEHNHNHDDHMKTTNSNIGASSSSSSLSSLSHYFSQHFTFPQYSSTSMGSIADIEVNIAESHANIKVRSKRRPKQLLKLVTGLQTLRLTILHLNVSTMDPVVLYCLNVKVEDDCKLATVDEIATAVYQLICRIHEEAMLNM